jgi:Zn finger protein HypA/HybF involved in hydrogenase expression
MNDNAGIPVFCADCGASGAVGQVTASLRCPNCQSANLGLTGVDPRPSRFASQHVAYPHGPGTGWGKPMPDPLAGWAQSAGNQPQTFPRSAPVADSRICPVCHGSKYDLIDKGPCRECGGTGAITHPTDRPATQDMDATTHAQPPGGAGWHGASLGGLSAEAMARMGGRPTTNPMGSPEEILMSSDPQYRSRVAPSIEFDPGNSESFYPKAHERSPHVKNWSPGSAPASERPASGYSPDLGYTEPNHYQMDQASCPNCGHAPTQLVKDKREDAWWHCPSCGPLANIDKHPEINPYAPPSNFTPDREMKTGGILPRKKTGRLFKMLAGIHANNDLSAAEAVSIARNTIVRYPEGN